MLEARNIHKVYNSGGKKLDVLKGINVTVENGEFAAIVGPSGAGKSTLLHILGGLDRPTQGNVVFAGEDVYGISDASLCRMRNKRIGFVFQFYHLLSEFTVLENVLLPTRIYRDRKSDPGESHKKAREFLREVGLQNRMKHFPNQLSGGEQQRVAIVRGLMNAPDLLLCDEPTGNLDSKTGDDIIALIKRIHSQEGMSVILVTHNLGLAKAADRLHHLRDGVLVN